MKMKDKKQAFLLYLCVFIFGAAGIYLTFFVGNTSGYDSTVKAHRIYVSENSDSDGTTYSPTYYYRVDGKEYECKAQMGSSSYPDESKNTIYYDSKNPQDCKTEYDKSSGKILGIVLLVLTGVMIYFFFIRKPSEKVEESVNQPIEIDPEKQRQIEENAQKVIEYAEKAQLIYKRVVIGVLIAILLFFTSIDAAIVKQTIIARNYTDVVATYVDKKETSDSTVFDDCIYTFKDKNGVEQEIILTVSKDEIPENEIKIKYDENNPQEYFTEGATMDKSGIIWFVVKVIAIILLIVIFCNKKLLNKVGVSAGRA